MEVLKDITGIKVFNNNKELIYQCDSVSFKICLEQNINLPKLSFIQTEFIIKNLEKYNVK